MFLIKECRGKKMSNTMGAISLTFGILGLCCAWLIEIFIPFVSILFPIIAIIFGAIGIKKDDSNGMAIAGLILGIISLVCIALIITVFAVLFAAIMGGLIPMGP